MCSVRSGCIEASGYLQPLPGRGEMLSDDAEIENVLPCFRRFAQIEPDPFETRLLAFDPGFDRYSL